MGTYAARHDKDADSTTTVCDPRPQDTSRGATQRSAKSHTPTLSRQEQRPPRDGRKSEKGAANERGASLNESARSPAPLSPVRTLRVNPGVVAAVREPLDATDR